MNRRVTSPCRDARSVRPLYQRLLRPSPLKVTASSWFDNGRSDRASLQGVVRAIGGIGADRRGKRDVSQLSSGRF